MDARYREYQRVAVKCGRSDSLARRRLRASASLRVRGRSQADHGFSQADRNEYFPVRLLSSWQVERGRLLVRPACRP
jgi:hypothetical protein